MQFTLDLQYRTGGQLFIGGKPVIDTLSFNRNPLYHIALSTCQIIVHPCKKEQKVYLEAQFVPNYIGNFDRTTFSGFRLM